MKGALDNVVISAIPTPEQMQQSSEAFVKALDFSSLEDFVNGYPSLPDEPGLYAVVAPDGVTAKVISSSMDVKEFHLVILHDVVKRLLRDIHRDCVEKGMTFDETTDAIFPKLLAAKKLYRLEKL